MAYKATGLDPEVELRRYYDNAKVEFNRLRLEIEHFDIRIRQAFAASKDSAEYMSAGRLVSERKKAIARQATCADTIKRNRKYFANPYTGI